MEPQDGDTSNIESKGDSLRKDVEYVEHTWSLDRLCTQYGTNPETGLGYEQVKVNRSIYGSNRLTPGKRTPWILKYLYHYLNFFSVLLIIAGSLCFVAYFLDVRQEPENIYLAVVLYIVVFVTSTFSFLQESKSEHVMESLTQLIPTKCHVLRDGYDNVIDAAELVPGDIVLLSDGDRVPADIRLISSDDLKIDNSSLTGESEPVERSSELLKDGDGHLVTQTLEANNLVFYTTIVVSGHGRGVVIGTGDHTVMGQIAGLTSETTNLQTPIAREINSFVFLIAALAVGSGVLFGVISVLIGNDWIETVVFAIGVIVANVPEGLVATVAVCLSLAARRMYIKNVLVKNLESVETLGSTTLIASDKTGTLTQNRMTVKHLWYDNWVFQTETPKNRLEWAAMFEDPLLFPVLYDRNSSTFQKLQLIATLCNNSSFVIPPGMDLEIELQRPGFNLLALTCSGDASEQGLLKFVEPIRSSRAVRLAWPKLFEIKFNSIRKWQLSIHKHEGGYPPLLVMKGAPERVLSFCTRILRNGQAEVLTEESRRNFQEAYERLGGYGERVLGLAYADMEGFANDYPFSNKPEPNFPMSNLVFVGLISLIDPPREGVPEAVSRCRSGGIKVIMVTGDHPITATAIAKEVGILSEDKLLTGQAVVVTGDEIRRWAELRDKADQIKCWDAALSHEQVVFARVSPAHKLLIVEHAQRRGEIVAVTGDGVNDAPALKKADIGVSMGISGKDVSKEASDMVLLDDNFSSIVSGVEEGRLIFDNLKKTICYGITVNIPELIPFLVAVIFGVPLPLSTILMVAICLGTDMMPAISLAYEDKESDIMHRPPRDARKDRLVTLHLISHSYLIVGVVATFAGFLAYMAVLNDYGYTPNILVNIDRGQYFSKEALLCTVDSNGYPLKCGYGCGEPSYSKGMNTSVKYCLDGCPIPLNGTVVDPFSEMNYNGFKGVQYCNLTCASDPSMFPGGTLPSQCSDPSLSPYIGFPGREPVGEPYAPVGAKYWWGGQSMPMPNWYYQEQVLLYAQSAYFVACVVTQWANLIICKTRKLSVFTHGMTNWVLNFSLLFETGVAILLLYTPGLQLVFSTRPILAVYWLCGAPFALGIFLIGELRKYIIRAYPGGFVDRWTYW